MEKVTQQEPLDTASLELTLLPLSDLLPGLPLAKPNREPKEQATP